jgi:hypothetical protein
MLLLALLLQQQQGAQVRSCVFCAFAGSAVVCWLLGSFLCAVGFGFGALWEQEDSMCTAPALCLSGGV